VRAPDLSQRIRPDTHELPTLRKLFIRMTNDGLLVRTQHGEYALRR